MNQPSDEIKSRLDIVEVIREYIQLKPAGINFRALCPFHHEKSPSFTVSPEKQIWHCFGCSKGGDIFSFVMEMEGISFVEALRLLAPKAGVQLKRQDPKLISQRNRLLDIVELSSKYYHKTVMESNNAENARKYLVERGLTEETIEEWQIGCSQNSWDDLINFLKAKGYNENEIFLAGMIVKKEGIGRFYNRFRGRIMFPIKDVNGNIVAFSARVSPEKEAEEKMGKYINSPQSMVYDKSKILFGLDKAKMEIKKQDKIIIVEGQMDVITAHQHGFTNVVASSGTALTSEQVKLIQRYTNNLIFALDADTAGELAVSRGEDIVKDVDYQEVEFEDSLGKIRKYVDPLLSHNINIKIVEIPNGKDPDECIKNNSGEWQKSVEEAKPIIQYHFDKALAGLDLDNIENRRQATQKLLPKIAKLNNKIEQDFWLKELSERIDVAEAILREAIVSAIKQPRPPLDNVSDQVRSVTKGMSREEKLSELLLALILKFPSLLEYSANYAQIDQIVGQKNQGLYRSLIFYYNSIIDRGDNKAEDDQNLIFNYSDFRQWLVNESKDVQPVILDKLALLGDQEFYNITIEQAKNEIIKIIVILRKHYLINRMKEIEKLIIQSEKEQDKKTTQELMEELKVLSDELSETGSN